MNDFKLIVYLQNYAIRWVIIISELSYSNNMQSRREKLGENKAGGNDYELLLPDKSINDPIDKISFDEVTSYLSKDQYEFI